MQRVSHYFVFRLEPPSVEPLLQHHEEYSSKDHGELLLHSTGWDHNETITKESMFVRVPGHKMSRVFLDSRQGFVGNVFLAKSLAYFLSAACPDKFGGCVTMSTKKSELSNHDISKH